MVFQHTVQINCTKIKVQGKKLLSVAEPEAAIEAAEMKGRWFILTDKLRKMQHKYKLSDIIVWDGAITKFGTALPLIRGIGNVRLATRDEIKRYYNRPEK